MQEEIDIEIQVEKTEDPRIKDLEKKKKKDLIFELALFFVLGILVGITIKTEAVKKITIGFNDYQIPPKVERYDVAKLKDDLIREAAKQKALEDSAQDNSIPQEQPSN